MTFASPLLLVAGATLSLVPVLLHLLRPAPPERAPLPTARFIGGQAPSRIRFARRLRDLPLMLLRSLFLLLLFAAVAEPRFEARRAGTAEIVLIDAEAAPAAQRGALLDSIRALASSRVIPVLFDTAAGEIDGPGQPAAPARASYAVALRALRTRAGTLASAESVRVTLVTAPRWGAWTPGTTALIAAWPSAIRLHTVRLPVSASSDTGVAGAARAFVRGDEDETRFVAAALAVLGYGTGTVENADLIVLFDTTDAVWTTTTSATVIAVLANGETRRSRDAVLLGDDHLKASGLALEPPAGSRIVAAWSDGAPAAVAWDRDGSCRVLTGIDFRAGAAPLDPGFPAALGRLSAACADRRDPHGDSPLDPGALRLLAGIAAGDTAPELVAAASLPGVSRGRPLYRPLLVLALLVALAETALAFRGDRNRTTLRR